MKHLIQLIILSACLIEAPAATWTIHNWRDNYLDIGLVGGTYQQTEIWREIFWDWGNDETFPNQAYSGVYDITSSPIVVLESGYQDSWTLTIDGPYALLAWAWISGGFPTYGAGMDFRYPPPDYIEAVYPPGEYWLDFSDDGLGRIATTQPPDFGKWAWDGSINPSWVEPAAPDPSRANHGKHLGQGK